MIDVVALGECLIDFTPEGINDIGMQLFSRNPGGAPANVLAMATRLGMQTAFVGKVGNDNFGAYLKTTLQAANINCEGLLMDNEHLTTLAFVHLDANGERSFSFYRNPGADTLLQTEELPLSLISDCRVFHFGAVSLTDNPSKDATLAAAQYAKDHGALISFDPNYRPFLWPDAATAKNQILQALPLAHILKVSEEEMELLTNKTDLHEGAENLALMGPSIVVVTLGAKGAYIRTPSMDFQLPTYAVKTVDTTGAGDAFWGAFLFGLLNCLKNGQDMRQLSQEDWRLMIDFSNAAGSLTTTKKGAIPAMPSKEEISNCLKVVNLLK